MSLAILLNQLPWPTAVHSICEELDGLLSPSNALPTYNAIDSKDVSSSRAVVPHPLLAYQYTIVTTELQKIITAAA